MSIGIRIIVRGRETPRAMRAGKSAIGGEGLNGILFDGVISFWNRLDQRARQTKNSAGRNRNNHWGFIGYRLV